MFAIIVGSIDYQTDFFLVIKVFDEKHKNRICVYALTSYRHKGQADITVLFVITLIKIGNYRKAAAKLRRYAYKTIYNSVAYYLRVANLVPYEHEKVTFLHMWKQRRSSASQ